MRLDLKWSGAKTWTCAIVAMGIVAAYTPALSNGSTWTIPYSGYASTSGGVITLQNTGSGYAVDAVAVNEGIFAEATSASGNGLYAIGGAQGIYGYGVGNYGIGVVGSTNASNGYGVEGMNGAVSVYGYNPNERGIAVEGDATAGGLGTGGYFAGYDAVEAVANEQYGTGVSATATNIGTALYGVGTGASQGVYGSSDTTDAVYGGGAIGIYGYSNGQNPNQAGYFNGNVEITGNLLVTGTINKSAVGFKIDHPLDPAHKFLMHSCIESNEMMNIYSGNVELDSSGAAVVSMPEWFQAENTDFRYQLSAIGKPAPGLYVSKEIENNQFEVAGGAPGMKVSWQVTGTRNDKYALSHPIKVEVAKTGADAGKYMRPEEYGRPQSSTVGYVPAPKAPRVDLTAISREKPILPKAPQNPRHK